MRDIDDLAIEEQIKELFEQNYEIMRLEGAHALSADVKQAALNQVLFYWRKLKEVAENVTDTEVMLSLPEQLTPDGKKYTIEGVVDIIREQGQTVMYDIKTHDSDYVRGNVPEYEKQLNVYAHIWQGLRQQELDQTAIIATSLPVTLRDAIRNDNQKQITREIERWQPLIDIPFNQEKVAETISEFGQVVDAIESRQFQPPSLDKLKGKLADKKVTFAVQVCRNCDARFSCSAYRRYVKSSSSQADSLLSRFLNEYGTDSQREDFLYANLENLPDVERFDI
jgi:hypothetical protein